MAKENISSNLDKIRHSFSHVLAQAVLEMFPEAKLGIGPAIDNGFYYDFELPRTLIPEDLKIIEKKMKKIISQNQKFVSGKQPADKAMDFLKEYNQKYKLELASDLIKSGEKEICFYENIQPENGSIKFVDMCAGPHVESTGKLPVKAFKLYSIAGAYWKGDEKNLMLQRIYGYAFSRKEDLDDYLNKIEEAKKRDHRKLGKDLDLFSVHEKAGPGLIYWHPKGARIRHIIETFWKEAHIKNGYEMVYTPHIGRSWLWETSGHLGFYRENMYAPMNIDEEEYFIKPMNCPFHIMIYNNSKRSYRELPMRWAELGTVYRYEHSGVLHGLLRVRGFTQDDAHIICTPEQIQDEIIEALRFSLFMWKSFGFEDIKAYIATKPDKSVGEKSRWDQATKSLIEAAEKEGLSFEMDEGGGAFYGPKIDLKIKDAIGREWQMSTIQFDFNLPERFDMKYIGQDGKEHRPYMVHRALLGSLERFFGLLVEHYSGSFPLWISPVQAVVIPVSDNFDAYGEKVYTELKNKGYRVEYVSADDSLNKRIRKAELSKIPYMLIVGEKEENDKTVSVRSYKTKDQKVYKMVDFYKLMNDEIKNKETGPA